MIHYHGTPITPRSEMMKMAGKCFCVSFASPQDADWCLAHGQSVLWDSGAFQAFRTMVEVDWNSYYKWLEPRLGHPHFAVIPDVIGGDVASQCELVADWPFDRTLGAPVWHMGLPITYLLELADQWPRICFGSSAAYWQVGSERWERRCDSAFNALEKHGLRPWVHMLRGLDLCGDRWPFASADSVNVARNFKRNAICPERMARRIDAVQSPIHWRIAAEQEDMFA
ncbi:hypothetical protein GOC14_07090 [Sinorhizobium meliloti]|nr:hypothetical protein [Sinorhizobium meliloti]